MTEFLNLMESWSGYAPVGGDQINESAVAQLVDLMANKSRMPFHRHQYLLREVITTSDFPNLFGVAIDRQVLAMYRAAEADWRSYFKMGTLPNFNTHRRHKVQGNDNYLPEVVEKGEYLTSPMSDAYYSIALKKYGRQFDISFEALINDSMGAFSDIPTRFANAVINSHSRSATMTFSSATGPNANLFGAPIADVDGQNVTNQGVLGLTIGNLETTLELMAAQTDVNGTPIRVRGAHLVVPPALEFTARQILSSANKMWVESAGGAATPYPTTNVVAQYGLQLHVDPWLPSVDTGGDVNTTWYVFGDPSMGAAMEFSFLAGYEDPEICMKASDKVAVGGGAPLSPFSGDFATDNIFYRVRAIYATAQLDPRFAYAQVG